MAKGQIHHICLVTDNTFMLNVCYVLFYFVFVRAISHSLSLKSSYLKSLTRFWPNITEVISAFSQLYVNLFTNTLGLQFANKCAFRLYALVIKVTSINIKKYQ